MDTELNKSEEQTNYSEIELELIQKMNDKVIRHNLEKEIKQAIEVTAENKKRQIRNKAKRARKARRKNRK